MLSWERTLGRKLRELGRLFVEHVVNRIEPEDERKLPQHERFDGEFYRRKKKSPLRNLNCTFGRIELKRCLYQPRESSGRCLFPLERRLGIVGGVATPALADEAAQAAADQPQRQVLQSLQERHGVSWSAQTLRKVVVAVSELYTPQRPEAQVQMLLGWLRAAEKSSGRHAPVLSVGREGIMLPIVARDKYQEGSTATVAVFDRNKKRLGTVDLGEMPESGQAALSEALTRLLTDVLTRGDGALPKLNYVTDGGHVEDPSRRRVPSPPQRGGLANDSRFGGERGGLFLWLPLPARTRHEDELRRRAPPRPAHRERRDGSRLQNAVHATLQAVGNEVDDHRRPTDPQPANHFPQPHLAHRPRPSLAIL